MVVSDRANVMFKTVLVKDVFEEYCYFYIDDKTKHGFLIDPGAEADKLLEIIRENGWIIEKILLTHGHFDHLGAVEKISDNLDIPYYIHENGEGYLKSSEYNLSGYCNRHIVLNDAVYLRDGDKVKLEEGDISLKVIYTPGHTTDSVVFYSEKDRLAFVGDTIFRGSIGNAGYPGGNMDELQKSIINSIFILSDDVKLLSGHSDETTVGLEKSRYGL